MTVAGAACAGIVADIVKDAFCIRGKGIEKYIRFGITLCITCVIVLPFTKAFKNIGTAFAYFPGYSGEAYECESDSLYILEKECEEKLKNEITSQIGIVPADITVEMVLSDNIPHIIKAVVTVFPEDAEELETIKQISFKALGREAETLIKEKDDENTE